ncbi:MAG: pilus assembly protein [Nocardioidaceae bacterium]|nr:pilus assembly protein [Nocardioidaceae bacterium]
MQRTRRSDEGAAVVDFVLVTALVVPLVLGVMQVGLVLHVRNTLTAAASEGARWAATADHGPTEGAARTRESVAEVLAGRYAQHVTASQTAVGGYPGIVVRVEAEVPALGLLGPSVALSVEAHAVEEPAVEELAP